MKKTYVWRWTCVVAVAFLALSVLQVGAQVAGAASRAMPSPVAIATVDLSRLLENLQEKDVKEKELEQFINELQAEVNTLVEKVKAAEQDLDVAPPAQQEAFTIKYLKLAAEAKVSKEIAEQRITRRTRQLQLDLFKKIKAAAADYAKAEGYRMVFCDDSAMEIPPGLTGPTLQAAILSQRLVYIDPAAVDITEDVSNQMNTIFARGQ